MSEQLLTKRLHVSGLTPSITPGDLERRLASFGKVKAMDGFDARDALGDPRKFGFVTMEIGTKELAKCLNVLSGSTWKGAKLRIGEAKPDFRERLAQFNSQPPQPVRPKRTRARNHGYPSPTLPLTPLSATAAASTSGWIATPSGRVVRPMRMRPERPLEPMHSERGSLKDKVINSKVKKRTRPPPLRARRRLIDPTKWDSVYLKGVFLDAIPMPLPSQKNALEFSGRVQDEILDEGDEEEGEEDSTDSDTSSDIVPSRPVPREVQDSVRAVPSPQQVQEAEHGRDVEMEDVGPPVARTANSAPQTDLKALFAPREDASFSLLDHLDPDLDLELGADILGTNAPACANQEDSHPSRPVLQAPSVQFSDTTTKTKARPRVTLDPSLPLLFPLPDSLPHSYTHPSESTTARHPHSTPACCLFSSAPRARTLHHLPPSTMFARSPQDTPESIRERWEKDKSALTREWKKAWREARGSRRGGRGTVGDVGRGY